jgi:dihydrofolate reductase
MRKVVYSAAMSLDGCIAGPKGESDWIVIDPDLDFDAMFARFDTILLGRKTYETTRSGGGGGMPGVKCYVFSRTLQQTDARRVTVSADPLQTVSDLKAQPGKDIWLVGGGALFRSLLELGLVDTLGGGVPLLPNTPERAGLRLVEHQVFGKTGTVTLEYAVR